MEAKFDHFFARHVEILRVIGMKNKLQRWYGLKCHDVHSKFYEVSFRYSNHEEIHKYRQQRDCIHLLWKSRLINKNENLHIFNL
jgi:hypothetical protein